MSENGGKFACPGLRSKKLKELLRAQYHFMLVALNLDLITTFDNCGQLAHKVSIREMVLAQSFTGDVKPFFTGCLDLADVLHPCPSSILASSDGISIDFVQDVSSSPHRQEYTNQMQLISLLQNLY